MPDRRAQTQTAQSIAETYPIPKAPQPWQLFKAYNSKARRWPGALRAALAILIPGSIALALGFDNAVLLICAGAMTVIYGEGHPFRSRIRVMAIAGSLLVASSGLGALVGELIFAPGHGHWWLMLSALFTITLAGVGTFMQNALRLPPPGMFFMVMVGGGSTMLAKSHVFIGDVLLWSIVGMLSAMVIGMAPMLVDRHGPERAAVATLEKAADSFVNGTHDVLGNHHSAQVALAAAWHALSDAGVVSGGQVIKESQAELVQRALAAQNAIVTRNRQLDMMVDSEALTDTPSSIDPSRTAIPHTRPTLQYRVYRCLVGDSHPVISAEKVVVAALATALVGLAVGFERPDWGSVSVLLLLQWGPDRIAGSVRAIQRVIGSCAGVGLFALFHVFDLHTWTLMIALAVCQFGAEIFVAKNYAICVIFSTPLALLMGSSAHTSISHSVGARVGEIAISVVFALFVLWWWKPGSRVRNEQRMQRRCVESMGTLLGLLALETPRESLMHRRDLQYELVSERLAIQSLAIDDGAVVHQYWERHVAIQKAGYALLDYCNVAPERRASDEELKKLAALTQQAVGNLGP